MFVEQVTYKGWSHCYRLANDEVELIVTGDVGPRIIRFGFIGSDNEFGEFAEQVGRVGGSEWRIYGGHRLWHSPEDKVRTYYPDNDPVEVIEENGTVRVIQPPEVTTGIQKEMAITLEAANRVEVRHFLRNVGPCPVELAPWALSAMAPGGMGIAPQPTKAHPDRLLPNRVLVLWPYTDYSHSLGLQIHLSVPGSERPAAHQNRAKCQRWLGRFPAPGPPFPQDF